MPDYTPTPHRAGTRHIRYYEDFLDICGWNVAGAATLRIAEAKTTELIKYFRDIWPDMPMDAIPDDELLWFDADYEMLENWSLRTRHRSSFAKMIAAGEKYVGDLVRLGFIKIRWMFLADINAGRGRPMYVQSDQVKFTDAGRAYVFADLNGAYLANGEMRSAYLDRFEERRRQMLYCIDVVNAALTGKAPTPRYSPSLCDKGSKEGTKGSVGGRDTALATTTMPQCAGDDPLNPTIPPSGQGGTSNPDDNEISAAFTGKDSMTTPVMQYVEAPKKPEISVEILSAPLSAQIVAELAFAILATVPREEINEATWSREWLRPAERFVAKQSIAHKIAAGSHERAWKLIERTLRYMATPGSPSWWQQGRAKQTPITLRHVEKEHEVQSADAEKHQWWPSETLPYAGPAWVDRDGKGQSGLDQDAALSLCDEIYAIYPRIALDIAPVVGHEGRYVVGAEYADGQFVDFWSREDWLRPAPDVTSRLVQAIAFGEEMWPLRQALGNQDSQGPPGPPTND